MDLKLSRLRSGEWIAGAGALVLLVTMLLPWYGYAGASGVAQITGWDVFIRLRWLILVTIIAGLALAVLQAACRAPAIPVSLSVIVTVLGALTSLWLIYRVLISVPGSDGLLDQKPAAYVGLASALALTVGGFRSLRQEDRPDPARNAEIPIIALDQEG
jgi:peptidoglycan biosynthesis protein MviN/MurJ (putative lipid II flippase)